MSSVKVEAAAVNAVRNLINLSNSMTSDEIKEGDRGVSFDGAIPLYLREDIKKENFLNKIDIQVKGRSVDKLSSAKKISFSMDVKDIKNYRSVGGTIIFFVQVTKDRTQYRMYYKTLLPYEINQLLESFDKDKISLSFDYIHSNDIKKFENVCFQFQSDKDKQYSYKETYMTMEDFIKEKGSFNLGTMFPSVSMNPVDYLNQKSFVYFQPEKYKNIQIPCGIAELTSISVKKIMNITIGSEHIKALVEIKQFSNHQTVSINNCIFYDSEKGMFTFNLNTNLEDALKNIVIIEKFIKHEMIIIDENKLSIASGSDYSILNHQIEVINKLSKIVNKLDVKSNPIIDFNDIQSIKNIGLIYNNLFEKKGIPFTNEYDVFLVKIKIFNITLSFSSQKSPDGTYNLYNLYDILTHNNVFSCEIKEQELVVIEPSFAIFNKSFKLDVSYLLADNIIDKLDNFIINDEKIIGNLFLETNLNWFILDSLEYYDSSKSSRLLNFLKKISLVLLKSDDCKYKYIYYINHCQILKRLNQLEKTEIKNLLSLKSTIDDNVAKACICILINNNDELEFYLDSLSDEQLSILKSFPIFNLVKKAND